MSHVDVEYVGGARYEANWRTVELVGDFYLSLTLGGLPVGDALNVTVACPGGLSVAGDECACPAGSEPTGVLSQCALCAAGQSKGVAGNFACSPCEPGSYAEASGGISCQPCAVQFAMPSEGATACTPCPSRTNSSAGQPQCDTCAAGFYRDTLETPASSATCKECLTGAWCPPNATLATLEILPGFWRLSTAAYEISRCPLSYGTDNGTELNICVGGVDTGHLGNGYCAANHSGPLCKVCDISGKHYESDQRHCVDCDGFAPWFVSICGLCFLLVAAFNAV